MDFVMADIHGAYRAYLQVMERSGFNPQRDRLFQLGDVVDKGYESYEVIEALCQLPNLVSVRGNHDQYFLEFLLGITPHKIHMKDMLKTIKSYEKYMGKITFWDKDLIKRVPKHHLELLKNQVAYYVDNNRLFIHAGIEPEYPISNQTQGTLQRDREFWKETMRCSGGLITTIDGFEEIYIGHTPVTLWQDQREDCEIMSRCGVTNLNTCIGFHGRLSMMNLDTEEVFYSDTIKELY